MLRPEELDIDMEAQFDHHLPALLPLGELELGDGAALRQKRSDQYSQ